MARKHLDEHLAAEFRPVDAFATVEAVSERKVQDSLEVTLCSAPQAWEDEAVALAIIPARCQRPHDVVWEWHGPLLTILWPKSGDNLLHDSDCLVDDVKVAIGQVNRLMFPTKRDATFAKPKSSK